MHQHPNLQPGDRVRHTTTGECGTVRELLPADQAYVVWDTAGAGIARCEHLRIAR